MAIGKSLTQHYTNYPTAQSTLNVQSKEETDTTIDTGNIDTVYELVDSNTAHGLQEPSQAINTATLNVQSKEETDTAIALVAQQSQAINTANIDKINQEQERIHESYLNDTRAVDYVRYATEFNKLSSEDKKIAPQELYWTRGADLIFMPYLMSSVYGEILPDHILLQNISAEEWLISNTSNTASEEEPQTSKDIGNVQAKGEAETSNRIISPTEHNGPTDHSGCYAQIPGSLQTVWISDCGVE